VGWAGLNGVLAFGSSGRGFLGRFLAGEREGPFG
jgi:hypothetical protein